MRGTLFAVGISVLISAVYSHSFLIVPEADWLNNDQPECRIGKPEDPGFENLEPLNCPGPCGVTGVRADRANGEFFSESKGMTTLQRGQTMLMKWTRNNHFGGFVRFTLVPKSQRMEKHVHEMFAFHFSCWEAGEIGCDGSWDCGTDESGLRYETNVVIPPVFHDGEYILGWTWYAGVNDLLGSSLGLQPESLLFGSGVRFRDGAERSEYGDYYSCANVKIAGGVEVKAEHKPKYIPGMNDESVTQCLSSVDRMGVCTIEPCKRDGVRFPAVLTTPHCFNPDTLEWDSNYRIRSSDVKASQNGGLASVDPCNGQQAASGEDDVATDSGKGSEDENEDTKNDSDIPRGPEDEESDDGEGSAGGSPRLKAIKLLDSNSGEIKDYSFNAPINVAEYKDSMTVLVEVGNSASASAVKFYINGRLAHTEGEAPFYIAGKTGDEVWPWTAPLNQEFTLRIDVEKDGQVVDSWTIYPDFQTF